MVERARRLPTPVVVALAAGVVALPILVAVVALAQRRWYPVLDLAMTELRVRDVGGRSTPLIGLPGRIGDLPEQGSHPGPLSFWALAPGYRLLGGSAWAMEGATALLALGWIALATWLGHRRLGLPGVALVAAVVAICVRGFGLSVLTQPWNPYLPLLAWLVVLLATWSVLDGDTAMLVPLAVAASYAAETHIPYLLMAGGLGALAAVVVAVRAARSRSTRALTWLAVTAGAFVALWIGPIAEQLRHGGDGNVARLLDHFGSPPEEAIGFVAGGRLLLRHLDVATGFGPLLTGTGRFVQASADSDGPIWSGLALLAGWVAAAVVAVRLGHRRLVALHATLGATLALTFASMSRIFGVRWFYLTLWAWITTILVVVSVAWTALAWLRARRPASGVAARVTPSALASAGLALATIVTVASLVVAPSTRHPEDQLGVPLGAVTGSTIAGLDPAGSYVVRFRDSTAFGSQAFGLVNELERAGIDAGMDEYWTVPITAALTKRDGGADRELRVATGRFVDEWRSTPGLLELASADVRTDAERAEYERLRAELLDELAAGGFDELVEAVDENLFQVTIDQRISRRAQQLSARMILIPQRIAVFLGPPPGGS